MIDTKLLGIYLNDHLAGSVTGIELVKRVLDNNPQGPIAKQMETMLPVLAEDQRTLERLLEAIGVSQDPLKRTAGWVAEKLGRLKLNGQLTGYSPLSRLIELEGLRLGVEGRLALWRSMAAINDADERLSGYDFDSLAARAEKNRAELEELRIEVAKDALTSLAEPR